MIIPHRVNKLEYDFSDNLYFIGYTSLIRKFLLEEDIMFENEQETEMEISIEELQKFVEDYEENPENYPEDLVKEIEKEEMIDSFKKEIKWAKENKQEFLIYHIF